MIIKNNEIRITCGSGCWPISIPITPVGANRYWIRKEPKVCQKHPGAHGFMKDDVIILKNNGEYVFSVRRWLADIQQICEQCGNPIPTYQHENLLGELMCKDCHKKIITRISE